MAGNLIPEGYRVHIDDFIPEGDVLIPGVVSADSGIREGDEVLVVGARARATGTGSPAGRRNYAFGPRRGGTGA